MHRRVLSILERRSGVEKRLDRLRAQLAAMVATALEVRA
jgi:type II secretory pathway component PulM